MYDYTNYGRFNPENIPRLDIDYMSEKEYRESLNDPYISMQNNSPYSSYTRQTNPSMQTEYYDFAQDTKYGKDITGESRTPKYDNFGNSFQYPIKAGFSSYEKSSDNKNMYWIIIIILIVCIMTLVVSSVNLFTSRFAKIS